MNPMIMECALFLRQLALQYTLFVNVKPLLLAEGFTAEEIKEGFNLFINGVFKDGKYY